MDYETAAMIMMTHTTVLQELTATENHHVYVPPENVDGFSPVRVEISDVKANIQPLTVTSNGTYYAESYGCDGFDPVNVNVPDRYDEGYAAGYEKGYSDGYEQGEKDGYSEGYSNGQQHGKFTFPEGTNYKDITMLIGDGTVTDETLGVSLHVDYERQANTELSVHMYFLLSDETRCDVSNNYYGYKNVTVIISNIFVDVENMQITYHEYVNISGVERNYDRVAKSDGLTRFMQQYCTGFGSSEHTYSATNAVTTTEE